MGYNKMDYEMIRMIRNKPMPKPKLDRINLKVGCNPQHQSCPKGALWVDQAFKDMMMDMNVDASHCKTESNATCKSFEGNKKKNNF